MDLGTSKTKGPTKDMLEAGVKAFKNASGGFASLSEKLHLAYMAMERVKNG